MGEIVSLSAKQLDAKELIRDLHQLKRNWSSHPELPVLSPRIINELLANVTTLENKLWDKSRSFVVAVLASPGLLFLAVPSRIFPIANILSFLFWTGLIGCPCYLFACAAKVQYRYTVYALTQVDDLRALSPLIQATRYGWGQCPEVLEAIRRLLEPVAEEHSGLLSDVVQMQLWKLAVESVMTPQLYDPVLALRTLKAIAHIGNGVMLIEMRHIANQKAENEIQHQVIEAARDFVPAMRARLKRQAVPQTLLRASCAPALPLDILLRAAHASKPEPAKQLLRASTSEDQEL